MNQDLYESDPLYHRTPLISPIPPPTYDLVHLFHRSGGNPAYLPQPIPFYLPQDHVPATIKAVPAETTPVPEQHDKNPQAPVISILQSSSESCGKFRSSILKSRVGKAETPDYDTFGDKIAYQENEKLLGEILSLPKETIHSLVKAVDPFALPVSHPFIRNRESFELAELDSVFHLISGCLSNSDAMTYLEISRKYGVYANYLNWKGKHKIRDGWGYSFTAEQTLINYSQGRQGVKTGLKSLNLYSSADRDALKSKIQSSENNSPGIDLIVSDTSCSFLQDYRVVQEEHSKRVVLNTLLMAFDLLVSDGRLVVKLVDTMSAFTAQLIYLTCLCFDQIALFRPRSSDPLSTHVYLVCLGFKKNDVSTQIRDHLHRVDEQFESFRGEHVFLNPYNPSAPISSHSSAVQNGVQDVIDLIQPDDVLNSPLADTLLNKNLKSLMERSRWLRDLLDLSKKPLSDAKKIYKQIVKDCHL